MRCASVGEKTLLIFNDAYATFLDGGAEAAIGQSLPVVWPSVWSDILPLVRKALSGESVSMTNMPLHTNRDDAAQETCWTFSYSPLYAETGEVAGFLNIAAETTDAVRREKQSDEKYEIAKDRIVKQAKVQRQQQDLQRELAHRIKNTLAMVLSIVSQSKRFASSMDEMQDAISERVSALAQAQDILRSFSEETADLAEIILSSLQPHLDRVDRVQISGPTVQITAQQALGLALAIHELRTNAVKYGALSNESGTVEVEWNLTGLDKSFRLEWNERDGPPLITPTRFGFGSRLTGSIVADYFQGVGKNFYEPSGLRFVLDGKFPEAKRPLSAS